jgi:hypothetical protein
MFFVVPSVFAQQPMNPTPQPLTGLPEHQVMLAGSPGVPTVVNNSSRGIIGYSIRYVRDKGPSIHQINVSFLGIRNHSAVENRGRIAPGTAMPADSPPEGTKTTTIIAAGPSPVKKAILDAVIFDDGEVVGPDTMHTFETATARIQAEQDLHQRVLKASHLTGPQKEAAWDEIRQLSLDAALASTDNSDYAQTRQRAAKEALRVREYLGDAAALELATRSAKYPKLWRKQP